jgi:LuxR family transcriptional regulator, maltose regulon positive regulatory protein
VAVAVAAVVAAAAPVAVAPVAVARRDQGKVAAARAELDELRRLTRDWRVPPWAATELSLAEAEQLVAERRTAEALALVESLTGAESDSLESRRRWVLHAELLLRADRVPEARVLLEPLLRSGQAQSAGVSALVVDAVAAARLGAEEEALRAMDRALHEAAPDQVRRPFLRHGPGVRELLAELVDRGNPEEAQALEILGLLGPHEPGSTAMPCYAEPLTDRELEVLHALQGKASNEEIAERLFVSLNTLRTHIKHIHRKLRTTSRRDAVTRARELALL